MNDYYRVPTSVLLGLLVVVFAALYARRRTQRRLLWLIGWTMAALRLAFLTEDAAPSTLGVALSRSCMMLAAIMFLGSLSPVEFGRRIRIPYVIPFSATLLFFVISTSLDPSPPLWLHILNILAVLMTAVVAFEWARKRQLLPVWFTIPWALIIGCICLYFAYIHEGESVLRLTHTAISIVTAMLVLAAYRRLTPGVIFTAAGFIVWSIPLLMEMLFPPLDPIWTPTYRVLNLMKVSTAMGMILLILEDEAQQNEAAQQRDRRARAEMEQYSKVNLSIEPHHDFGIQYNEVCAAITAAGHFRQAAIFLVDVEQNLHVAASSGLDAGLSAALEGLGLRASPETHSLWARSHTAPLKISGVTELDLRPWMRPDDELDLQKFTGIYAIPIAARSGDLQGLLVLAGLQYGNEPPLPEEMLPLKLLTARVGAARESGLLLRRVTQSEKLAGIGRLAAGVAHELNNPLTVVMGYAELIQETTVDDKARRNAGIIRSESQRMRQIIESLGQFWKPSPSPPSPVAVSELLAEVDMLRRRDYESKNIHFEVIADPGLPRIHANADQMRQVLLQTLDTAAAQDAYDGQEKRVRVESMRTTDRIKIVISNSGGGFPHPDQVFDPFCTIQPASETHCLALSLCYSIIREQGGDMSALNLFPHGAALVIELPIEPLHSDPEVKSAAS